MSNVVVPVRVCNLSGAQAKRAAREAVRGFNVRQVAAQVYDFVNGGGDVLALEPLGKIGTALAQKIAGIYGLRHSLQVRTLGDCAVRSTLSRWGCSGRDEAGSP